MKKAISVICVLCMFVTMFCGCGYRLSIEKVDKDEDKDEQTEITETTTEAPTTEPTTEAPTTEEPTTVDELEAMGIIVENDFQAVAMDKAAVLNYYTSAVNDVKLRCPGFSKREYQEIGDVVAGNGGLSIANKILNLIANELIKSSGTGETPVTVNAHDDVTVRDQFPVFGMEYGCRVEDISIIKSAVCYTNGKQNKIVITFNDQLNPEPGQGDFSNIMTPIERQKIADGVSEYVVVLNDESFKFDFNYTDCEIICYTDAKTNRIISLTQKMHIDIDIDFNLDLFLFKTDVVKAKGSLVNHLEYTDFDWTE